MPSNVTTRLPSLLRGVNRGVIDRGREYFRSGMVTFFEAFRDHVEATVSGSDDYDVWVELSASKQHNNDCTCPYFEDHRTCKHIIAVLYDAEERGLLDTRSVRSVSAGGLRFEPPAPAKRQPAKPPAGPPASAVAPWQRHLQAVAEFAQPRPASPPVPTGGQIVYILDPFAPRNWDDHDLEWEVAYRLPLKDGSWSVLKQHPWKQSDLDQLPTATDRKALALLMGSKASATQHSDYSFYSNRASRYAPPPTIQAQLLDLAGPTGRCMLRLSTNPNDLLALSWDPGGPWELCLEINPADNAESYALASVFRRGEEAMAVTQPDLVTQDGVIVVGQTLSRVELDRPGLSAWITAERLPMHSGKPAGPVIVPRGEIDALLTHILRLPSLPALRLPEELRVTPMDGTPSPRFTVAAPTSDQRSKQLDAELTVAYSEQVIDRPGEPAGVYDPATRGLIRRDPQAEDAFADALLAAGVAAPPPYDRRHPWHFAVKPADLPRVAATLIAAGWQVEASGKRYRAAGELNLNVTSGIDWFDLQGKADFGDQTADLPALLRALRDGSHTVTLDDGTLGLLPEQWLSRYALLADMGEKSEGGLRFNNAQAMLLDALLAELPGVDADAQFRKVCDRLKQAGSVKPRKPPRTFQGELRTYQQEGLGWLTHLGKLGLGGCLADDMGLGKTIQVLAMLEARRTAKKADRPAHPSLVIAPKSLIFNWQQEAARFTPNLKVLNHTGNTRFSCHDVTAAELQDPEHDAQPADLFADCDLVLTTYGTLRRDAALLAQARFDYVVLDEAQAIKNHNTASAKAARLLRADHRLAVSGTPIENHLGELWSMFAFINPGMIARGKLSQQLQSGGKNLDDQARKVLANAVRPYILRRTKDQVAPDLPDKHEQTVYCEMSTKQRKLYNDLRDHYRASLMGHIKAHGLANAKIIVLEALLRLRQAACHPGLISANHAKADSAKLDDLLARVESVVEEGHKALIFSQFTKFLALAQKRIDKLGIKYQYLDGKTTDRQQRVEQFQDDPDCKLFLISLKAGGTGLNLTAADYVFLLDPWWNPAVEAQAIDRTHRIGQDKHVFAYRLITKDTVEEKVLELQQTKRELADAILTQDNSILRNLTPEDLQHLLS